MSSGLNVSLEPHLLSTLKTVHKLLPEDIRNDLDVHLGDPPKSVIPHELLSRVSAWARTTEGEQLLRSKSISPFDYSMVSLLAGTTTSPEKDFGEYKAPKGPEQVAADRARERKLIAALVNSLFSVFGAGFAAWWGADRTGWKDEYVRGSFERQDFD